MKKGLHASLLLAAFLFGGVTLIAQTPRPSPTNGGGAGGGATIPSTTSALKGDGLGNAAAVTGTTTNCVHVDGTSAACPGGGGTGSAAGYTSVTFSATPLFTALSNTVDAWTITLTGNVTSSTLASATAGQRLGFKICQDGTGSRTFAWPTGFANAADISPTALACTKQEFFWDGTNAIPVATATSDGGPSIFTTEQAAPGTPAATKVFCWPDSTDHAGLECKANNSANTFKMTLSGVDINSLTGQVTASHFAAALPVAQGGLGLATLTLHALYVGNTTSAPNALAVCGTDKPVVGQSAADPVCSKVTLTNPATGATITVLDGKTLTVNNTMTFAGTDAQTYTFPSTSATMARTDAANTFTGVQTFSTPIASTSLAVALASQTSLRSNAMAAAAGDATIGQVIAHGSTALDFASTATGACATVIQATATGVVGTDVFIANSNASIKAVTGFVPASTGGFSVNVFPTTDKVNFEACNWTAGTVDPASFTMNWIALR